MFSSRTKKLMSPFVKCLWWHHLRKSRSLLQHLIRYVMMLSASCVEYFVCTIRTNVIQIFLCLHSLLSNCCITEATTNIHIPGEFPSTKVRHLLQEEEIQHGKILYVLMNDFPVTSHFSAILTTICWKILSCLTSFLCDSTAGCSSSKMWLEMRSVVGHFMARGERLLKCAAPPLSMPQKRSRQR